MQWGARVTSSKLPPCIVGCNAYKLRLLALHKQPVPCAIGHDLPGPRHIKFLSKLIDSVADPGTYDTIRCQLADHKTRASTDRAADRDLRRSATQCRHDERFCSAARARNLPDRLPFASKK